MLLADKDDLQQRLRLSMLQVVEVSMLSQHGRTLACKNKRARHFHIHIYTYTHAQ